jgi:phosphate uptake regulator
MTRERYHRIMHDVEQELLHMGEMVIAVIDRSIQALKNVDKTEAERIIFLFTGEIVGD